MNWSITNTPSTEWKKLQTVSKKTRCQSGSGWWSTLPSIRLEQVPYPDDLVTANRFPVHETGRGGEYTYHGPGQRVCYAMLDLNRRTPDVRAYVSSLEAWIINTLAHFNVKGERREDRVGVWVKRPDKAPLPDGSPREDKIAAIGIRVRRWVTFHGISINVEPELEHYSGIVPCGISDHGVTSLVDLGLPVTMADLDIALKQEFEKLFGSVETDR